MLDQINKFANTASTTINDAINENRPTNIGEAISENFTQTSDRVLDNVVDSNRRMVEFVVTTADRVSGQVSVELPFADRLPTPAEAGEAYLDFVERAVSMNREMNERVADMLNVDQPQAAPKVTAKKAPVKKASAKRAPVKKAPVRKTTKTATKKSTTKTAASKASATK